MSTVIIPIIKCKKESITSKNNYRPIAITTAASKILELAILDKIEDNLITGHKSVWIQEEAWDRYTCVLH